MSIECHKCSTDCVSEYITCIKCNSFLHFKCMHAAGIIKNPWSNSNKLPAYALSILNSENILYLCNSCKPNFTMNIPTPISQLTSNTPSDITAKLDEIKNIVDNTYIITNTHKKTFADVLINSIEPKLNTISDNMNKSGNHSNSTKLDYKLSITIEHIDIKNCNTEYIKSLFTLLHISFSSITNIFFRNNNAYVYFINSFSKFDFLSCTRLSRSKLIGTDYNYIFIRDYLDKDIFKRGRVYYHALISKLITDYKSVFNYKTKHYELRPLIKIDGIDKIDWICNSFVPSTIQFEEWNTSFEKFILSKKSNSPNDTEPSNGSFSSD